MTTLYNKVVQFGVDADLTHKYVHGPATGPDSVIETESGTVPTLAKQRADLAVELGADAVISQSWSNAQLAAQHAQDALQSVTDAEAEKFEAQTAKTGAEAARDALNTTGKVFTAAEHIAGTSLTGTTNGQQFAVLADNLLYWEIYRNNAGVALLLSSAYTKAFMEAVLAKLAAIPVNSAVFASQDASDNAAMLAEATGRVLYSSVDAEIINGFPRSALTKALRYVPKFNSSVSARISYGQSLSLGNAGSIHTRPDVDDGFFDCMMFSANGSTTAGPRAQEGSGTAEQNHAALVPYKEMPITGGSPSGNFQTPLGNALRMIKRLLRDENGVLPADFDYLLLGSAPGQSNTAIAGLIKGQTPYANLLLDVTYGLARAQEMVKSYAVDIIYWSHGERDIQLLTSRGGYLAAFLQMYADLNADIKAITGQAHNIKLVMYQCAMVAQASPAIALAQLDAAKANSNIIIATALYAIEHHSPTNAHLAGAGYAHLGAYYGLADKRVVLDQHAWVNFYPSRITRQGVILDVEFPDTGYPLAISNALFDTQANAGITAIATGGADNTVVSVTVVGPRRIRVVLTNATAGSLRYGFASWGGNLHNLCDLDAGMARSVPLYQPCLTFEESFA